MGHPSRSAARRLSLSRRPLLTADRWSALVDMPTDEESLIRHCTLSRASMDGRGRFMDNIFIERLWRSIKYEEVHLKAYADGREGRAGIGSWMTFYNFRRPHQAMNNQTPMAVWRNGMDKIEAAARAVDMPLRLDNANALPTYPQHNQHEAA